MFQAEYQALRLTFKLSRPTMRETLAVAGLYAAQAVTGVFLLKVLYFHLHWNEVLWAMISVILALQPGWSQSVVTSIIRIAANTVGAGVALGVSQIAIGPELQLMVSLVIVVFTCELLRLGQALRTACVAVIIVLTNSGGHVLSTGTQRFSATVVGCLMALLVQLVTDIIRKKLPGRSAAVVMVMKS